MPDQKLSGGTYYQGITKKRGGVRSYTIISLTHPPQPSLLLSLHTQRLSAKRLLEHEWITSCTAPTQVLQGLVNRYNQWKNEVGESSTTSSSDFTRSIGTEESAITQNYSSWSFSTVSDHRFTRDFEQGDFRSQEGESLGEVSLDGGDNSLEAAINMTGQVTDIDYQRSVRMIIPWDLNSSCPSLIPCCLYPLPHSPSPPPHCSMRTTMIPPIPKRLRRDLQFVYPILMPWMPCASQGGTPQQRKSRPPPLPFPLGLGRKPSGLWPPRRLD